MWDLLLDEGRKQVGPTYLEVAAALQWVARRLQGGVVLKWV